jgi:hypothetical protein
LPPALEEVLSPPAGPIGPELQPPQTLPPGLESLPQPLERLPAPR